MSEEVIREVRDLPDGMYTFAYELSVEVIIGASWGYISNERIEVGPSEIRKQIGEGDDARWDPLPEPDDEVGGPDPQRG